MMLRFGLVAGALCLGLAQATPAADACTRALYVSEDGLVVTGRSMDWNEDMHSDIWLFPEGMARDGAAGPQSIKWTSKYGSLIVAGYNAGTADGINEKGLVANVLYLAEFEYPAPEAGKPKLSIAAWAQYALDNYATVSEAVTALASDPFTILAPTLPNGKGAQLHLVLSDSTGDSAIFEYIDGKLVIHHSKDYRVVTNSPSYDQQLAIDAYWKRVGGLSFLPGTVNPADRFVRASFLVGQLPKGVDKRIITALPGRKFAFQAVAGVLGVIRAVGVPLGYKGPPDQPNVSSTLWRTAYDQRDLVMYFNSATTPNTFWVPMSEMDFKAGAPVMELPLAGGKVYAGDASTKFEKADPFKFLSP